MTSPLPPDLQTYLDGLVRLTNRGSVRLQRDGAVPLDGTDAHLPAAGVQSTALVPVAVPFAIRSFTR